MSVSKILFNILKFFFHKKTSILKKNITDTENGSENAKFANHLRTAQFELANRNYHPLTSRRNRSGQPHRSERFPTIQTHPLKTRI